MRYVSVDFTKLFIMERKTSRKKFKWYIRKNFIKSRHLAGRNQDSKLLHNVFQPGIVNILKKRC